MQRTFYSAFAAILLSALLVQPAAAIPTTAKKAAVAVSGTYNPLDLNLNTLVNGTAALNYTVGGGPFSFQVDLSGTFTGVGYAASGQAGNWNLSLGDSYAGITSNDDASVIYLFSSAAGLQVGTLTYLGGLSVDSGSLLAADTPVIGDVFKLYTTAVGSSTVLDVLCYDGLATCNNFDLTLLQPLQHIGPFNVLGASGQIGLVANKLNEACGPATDPHPCGSLTNLTASSIPEPATLALVGLGLAGLGLSRRARARA